MGKWSPGDRICGHWPCWSVLPCEPWGSWETWRGVSLASHPGLGPVRGLHESCTQLDRVDQGAPCPIQAFLLCLITWLPDGSTSVFSFVVSVCCGPACSLYEHSYEQVSCPNRSKGSWLSMVSRCPDSPTHQVPIVWPCLHLLLFRLYYLLASVLYWSV